MLTLGLFFGAFVSISWSLNAIATKLKSIDDSLKWQNARLAAHDQHAAQQHAASWAPPPAH